MTTILVASPEASAEGLSIFNLIRDAVAQRLASANSAKSAPEHQPISSGAVQPQDQFLISPAATAPTPAPAGTAPQNTPTNSADISLSCKVVLGGTNDEWKTHDHVVFILDITDKHGFDALRRHHSSLVTQAFRAKKHSIATALHIIGVTSSGKPVAVPENVVSKWCHRKSDVGSITYYDRKTKHDRFAKRVADLAVASSQPTAPVESEEPEEAPLDYEAELKALRRKEFEMAMHTALEADRSSEIDSEEEDHISVASDPSSLHLPTPADWDEEAVLRALVEKAFSMHYLESSPPLEDSCGSGNNPFDLPLVGRLSSSRGLQHRSRSMTPTNSCYRPSPPVQSTSLPSSRCISPVRVPSPNCVSSLACRSNDNQARAKTDAIPSSREVSPRGSFLRFLSRNGSPRPQSPQSSQTTHKGRWFGFI